MKGIPQLIRTTLVGGLLFPVAGLVFIFLNPEDK